MKDASLMDLENRLNDVINGTYTIHKTDTTETIGRTESYTTKHPNLGKGLIDEYLIFPGITLFYQYFLGNVIDFHHDSLHSSLEINHCHQGRIGMHMNKNQKVFLGEGDMALQPMDCCADAEITLPLGFYEGIMITIDLERLIHNPPSFFPSEFNAGTILQVKFCEEGKPFALPANHRIEHIFCELYQVPTEFKIPYMKLKVLELILFLCLLEPKDEQSLSPYQSDQVEIIKQIHNKLICNLNQRYTIEELSSEYLINATTLKTTFKNIYGLPIATYMKKYRIDAAATMLRESDASIAVIASSIGYESQGKFTKAFKEQVGISPSDYRRQSHVL
ncbi:helix-turn-helix domain-containing protein [Anaerosporobacter faecicola]|uniref:helix-turn-helix domain-containing protein n=1 Tax=Anaerosporobacter faecicola TaxID=2718714 RepID=UPI00143C7667|nr:AraC family transcriptional regulator [Anaerosporobacter faecicola]